MKKVLSLLLVVTMLFSVFSIASSAAINDNALASIIVTPKEDRDYQKGEEIIFEVSLEVDQEWFGEGVGSGCFVFGYNSAVLEPVSALPQTKKAGIATAGVIVEGYEFGKDANFLLDDDLGTYVKGLTDAQPMVDEDLAKGWDKAISICMMSTYGMLYQYASPKKIFAFKMKVKEDAAAGDYTVGIAKTSMVIDGDVEKTFIDDPNGGIGGATRGDNWLEPESAPAWDRRDAAFTVAAATPAEPTVTHIDTMGQMKNWKNHEFPFNAGLVGQISNLPLSFDGNNHSVELEKIEVSIKTAESTTVAQAYTVYKVNDTTWNFRAVIPNLDAEKVENDGNMECQYTIYVDDDNNDETPAKKYSSDVFNTNLKAIYVEACDNYPG